MKLNLVFYIFLGQNVITELRNRRVWDNSTNYLIMSHFPLRGWNALVDDFEGSLDDPLVFHVMLPLENYQFEFFIIDEQLKDRSVKEVSLMDVQVLNDAGSGVITFLNDTELFLPWFRRFDSYILEVLWKQVIDTNLLLHYLFLQVLAEFVLDLLFGDDPLLASLLTEYLLVKKVALVEPETAIRVNLRIPLNHLSKVHIEHHSLVRVRHELQHLLINLYASTLVLVFKPILQKLLLSLVDPLNLLGRHKNCGIRDIT